MPSVMVSIYDDPDWRVSLNIKGRWVLERLGANDDGYAPVITIYGATDRLPTGEIAAQAVIEASHQATRPKADPPNDAPMRSCFTGEYPRTPIADTEWMMQWEVFYRCQVILAIAQECMRAEALEAGMAEEVPTDADIA